MSALITASSISSYRAALARWSSHHCQPTLGCRIKEGQGWFSLFEFQRRFDSFGSAQLVHNALQGFPAFRLQVQGRTGSLPFIFVQAGEGDQESRLALLGW